MKKEFGKDDNNGKESMTWKNRERDWYNTERRFIFACKTQKQADRWINTFNKQAVKNGLA
jgi:hypothetical protein